METLNKLKQLDLETCTPEEISALVNMIGALPIMKTDYSPGKIFERAMKNNNGEPDFTTVERLSFCPPEFNKDFLRASTPDNTMFYGSVLKDYYTPDDVGYARMTACCETSDLLRDNTIPEGERIMTLGTWRVKEPLVLATIFDPTKTYPVDYLNEVKDAYIKTLNDLNPELKEKGLEYLNFLASEFSKDVKKGENHKYLISAIFSKLISTTGVDGILYSSVRAAGLGLCVALQPRVMDKLELIFVNKCHVKKENGKVTIRYIGRCKVPSGAKTFEILSMEEFYQKHPELMNNK
jgi:hypothetical protein